MSDKDVREEIDKQFYGETSTEKEVKEEVKEEKTETTSETVEQETKATEVQEAEKTEEEVKEETKEETKEEKGDLKSALKEERIKRRQLKSELETRIKEKESQLNEALQTIRDITKPTEEDTQTIESYDKEILKLREKIQELDRWKDGTSKKIEEDEKQKSYRELMTRVENTDKELNESGYPGFQRFKTLVSEELNKLPDSERADMDNEEGWKEIYRETVFPSLKGIFESAKKEDIKQKKIEDKKQVQMLGETKGGSTQAIEKDWTWDDYLKWRQGRK